MSWPREPACTRILGAVVVAPMNLKREAWIIPLSEFSAMCMSFQVYGINAPRQLFDTVAAAVTGSSAHQRPTRVAMSLHVPWHRRCIVPCLCRSAGQCNGEGTS
jgi:hypothetical protein